MKLFLALILMVLSFASCLRFYPSRTEEITNETPPTEDTEQYLLGEDYFFGIDKENKSRLAELVKSRRNLKTFKKSENYHIGADDLIEVNVFDVPELNTTVRVRPSGYINLPLVGAIQSQGLTEEELQKSLSDRLNKFVKDPQVRVFISEYAANSIYLLGRVVNPGKVPLKRDTYSLLAVLSQAGIKNDQAIGPIVVIPGGANQTQSQDSETLQLSPKGIEIWYDDLIGGAASLPLDIPLLAGDVVVVKEPAIIVVDGEVKKIGPIDPTSRPTLVGAIGAAQGVTYSADIHAVEVIRTVDADKKALLTVDLESILMRNGKDFRLHDGDIVRVPSQGTRFVTRQMVDSINRFVSFTFGGRYDVTQ